MSKLEFGLNLTETSKWRNNINLWIVGRSYGSDSPWAFLGVYDTEEAAVNACQLAIDFIAPATLNKDTTEDGGDWPGCRYPLDPDNN